jgi:hypothetical protein
MIVPLPSQPGPFRPRRVIAAIFQALRTLLRGKRNRASGTRTPYQSPPGYGATIQAGPLLSPPIYNRPSIVPPPPAEAAAASVPPQVPAAPAMPDVGLTAGGTPLNTPAALKAVLSLTELQWVGLKPTFHEAEVTVEDGNGVAASWTSESGANGGIELDLFRAPAGDAATILKGVVKEGDGTPVATQVAEADEAYQAETDQYAWLAARRGPLVFVLSVPAGPRAAQQLAYLGGLVLHRVSAG